MNSVSIDFVAGAHGQFLEYMCNRFIAHHGIFYSPFNQLGASHMNMRRQNYVFKANHFSLLNLPKQQRVIKISFNYKDLLPLSSGCFLRAGDSNIDVRSLEIDTYNKLCNGYFDSLVSAINSAYAKEVNLTRATPNCPRYILREFFKFGFKTPELNGLIQELNKFDYAAGTDLYEFKFEYFYDTEIFIKQLENLSHWYGSRFNSDEARDLHKDFLSRQIFRNDKKQCDALLASIANKQSVPIPNLSVLQESYINAKLENLYQIEMPFIQEKYFNSTQDIVQYINV